jgi:hypothetical protein
MNSQSTYRIYVATLFVLFGLNFSFSQDDECGEPTNKEEYLQYFQQIKEKSYDLERQFLIDRQAARFGTTVTSLPIKAHIIRNDNGTGGLTEAELNDALAIMNSYYINAGLEFFLCSGINYIDDSDFYSLERSEESSLTSGNDVANVINIYFANQLFSSTGSSLCGYAYYPGGPLRIMMANGCVGNGSTLAHEMGHFFGLFHTHGNSNTPGATTELVNGSNCDSSGDFICDTPADPVLSTGNVTFNCLYTGNLRDANNDLYEPDPHNIMSYSRKECRDLFTEEQYARINATYQTSRSYLECPSFNADFSADVTESCDANLTVNFTESSVGATSWSWDIDGDGFEDYNSRNIVHTYNNAGDFDVTLTISNGNNSISKVKYNYIDVGAQEIETDQITLTLTLDSWPSETSWAFSDSNGEIIRGGPYQEGVDDNATKIVTFDVNPNLCYKFEIFDVFGDGICCGQGNGNYELRTADNTLIASGSDFGASASHNFFNGSLLSTTDLAKEDIVLYPNPANSEINLSIANSILPNNLTIYSALGQQLIKKEVNTQEDLSINVQELRAGLYILKLENDNGEKSLPFIKQ